MEQIRRGYHCCIGCISLHRLLTLWRHPRQLGPRRLNTADLLRKELLPGPSLGAGETPDKDVLFVFVPRYFFVLRASCLNRQSYSMHAGGTVEMSLWWGSDILPSAMLWPGLWQTIRGCTRGEACRFKHNYLQQGRLWRGTSCPQVPL